MYYNNPLNENFLPMFPGCKPRIANIWNQANRVSDSGKQSLTIKINREAMLLVCEVITPKDILKLTSTDCFKSLPAMESISVNNMAFLFYCSSRVTDEKFPTSFP